MRPPFEKASIEKESVVKCYYDSRFFKVSTQRLCQSYPPYDRFHCCLSPLVVQLLELEILFLNWSC